MADNQVLSDTVSEVLDWIGMSHDEVQWRVETWKQYDSVVNIIEPVLGNISVRVTGSRPEGIGINVLGSDLDIMGFNTTSLFRLISDVSDWKPSLPFNYFVDTSDVHPGYCRLFPMHLNEPTLFKANKIKHKRRPKSFPNWDPYCGFLVLSNNQNVLPNQVQLFSHQGPARTYSRGIGVDGVTCFHSSWPISANEWIDRNRPSKYPSMHFVHRAAIAGIKVVPIGHKRSKYTNTEWRFSFSFTELDLVHMWPNTVLKCYVLLKLLKTSITSELPHLKHTLSSYYLKTLLFWLTEETGLQYWNSHSLMECLMFSLKRLLTWIDHGCIPHYFVRNSNLFDNETGTPRQTELIAVIRHTVSKGPMCILRCQSFSEWYREMRETCPADYHIVIRNEKLVLKFHIVTYMNNALKRLMEGIVYRDVIDSVTYLLDIICILTTSMLQFDNDSYVCGSIRRLVEGLRNICSSLLLTFFSQNKMDNVTRFHLLRIMENMLTSAHGNTSATLKLANLYFHIGYYNEAIGVLQHFSKMCYIREVEMATIAKIDVATFDAFFEKVTIVLVFVHSELYVSPHALKFEMFKHDCCCISNIEDKILSKRRNVALVDPDVFLHFLQYMCYNQLNTRKLADAAFRQLRSIVKTGVRTGEVLYTDSALNILGHCYLGCNKLSQAAACFVNSLRVQSKFTVALLNLAISIAKYVNYGEK